METTLTVDKKSAAIRNIEEYFKSHDTMYVSEDAVFDNMGTGEEYKGRKAIGDMLQYMYHVAFDAKAVVVNTIITEKKALLEATFTGKHIGEFAGVAPTNIEVKVPLCVSYELNDEGLIERGRIYMLTDVLLQQIKAAQN